MYNATSFMFLKIGIAYTELIPSAEPYTNLFTLKGIDTTSDTRESTLVKWYAEDGERHERYKVTYVMNKLQRNVVMIFQRFDNDGNEWQRYSYVMDN